VLIYKTKTFARFARRQSIKDLSLIEAIERARAGLIDADLGGGMIKQRIARAGRGRSGGHRTLIAYQAGNLAIFLFGFSKSETENITDDELEDLQLIATQWLTDAGILIEVGRGIKI